MAPNGAPFRRISVPDGARPDSAGRAIAFRIAPGQAHARPHAIPLLDQMPGVPLWVMADRGYQQSLSPAPLEAGGTCGYPVAAS